MRLHAAVFRRIRTHRGRFLPRRDRVDVARAAPVREAPVREAPVREAPVREVPAAVVGFARRFDVPVGRGRCLLAPVFGLARRLDDPVGRRSGGFRESLTPGV